MSIKLPPVFSTLLLAFPLICQAELSAMADADMQSVSGKGIEIDASVDFAQDTPFSYADSDWGTNATDDTYIAYRQVIVDELGNRLTDSDNDGYLNVFNNGANVKKSDSLNGYNVVYKDPRPDGGDYLIRKPAYIMMGEISGGISFTGLKFDFVSDFGYDETKPLTEDNRPRPAMKWTLPDQVNFKDFEVSGLYISSDAIISKNDNKLFGVRLDGPIYLPSATASYVFVTSD
jgi:Family of unknown function (DUF6160)